MLLIILFVNAITLRNNSMDMWIVFGILLLVCVIWYVKMYGCIIY